MLTSVHTAYILSEAHRPISKLPSTERQGSGATRRSDHGGAGYNETSGPAADSKRDIGFNGPMVSSFRPPHGKRCSLLL
jgi:hypothetical protein